MQSLARLLCFLLLPAFCPGRDPAVTIKEIEAAVRIGNSSEFAKHFASNVDINMPEKEGVFSKSQATLIIKDFFAQHKAEIFNILHTGKSKDSSIYAIGTYKTSATSFRTYFYLKPEGNRYMIQEINFEEEGK